MKLIFTTASKKALEIIKKRMKKQFEDNNINKFKIKFTKKKEFIAVPIPYDGPAFQLYLNGKFQNSYFMKKGKWKKI